MIGFLLNLEGWEIKKCPDLGPSSPSHEKVLLKILLVTVCIS